MFDDEVQALFGGSSKDLLTTLQVAKTLGISEKQVIGYISKGKLQATKIAGGYLVDPKDVKLLQRSLGNF